MFYIALSISYCGWLSYKAYLYYLNNFKCIHSWKRFQRVALQSKDGKIHGYQYHCECTKCGAVKTSEVV